MQNYIGTKLVKAMPMTRQEYNDLRGWKVPANENPEDDGYLVEYPDSEANHQDFAGYISWCPKKQFEEANICYSYYRNKPDFVNRMLAEYAQLTYRINKLHSFLSGEAMLSTQERDLMVCQLAAMRNYADALKVRIVASGVQV
jgi:hypothetical protein